MQLYKKSSKHWLLLDEPSPPDNSVDRQNFANSVGDHHPNRTLLEPMNDVEMDGCMHKEIDKYIKYKDRWKKRVTHLHLHLHLHFHLRMYERMHVYINNIHIHIHRYIYICMDIDTYTYTHACTYMDISMGNQINK